MLPAEAPEALNAAIAEWLARPVDGRNSNAGREISVEVRT
jgi:hypothetical protein